MPTFYEIQSEIAAMLDLPEEELTDNQRNALDEYIDELGTQEADKIDGFAQFIKLQSAYAEAIKEESQRLAARARTASNRLAYLKGQYTNIMQTHGLKKLSGHSYTLSVRESKAVAVTALVETLPELYRREKTTVEADKVAIKKALTAGLEIPGCALQPTYSLQIK